MGEFPPTSMFTVRMLNEWKCFFFFKEFMFTNKSFRRTWLFFNAWCNNNSPILILVSHKIYCPDLQLRSHIKVVLPGGARCAKVNVNVPLLSLVTVSIWFHRSCTPSTLLFLLFEFIWLSGSYECAACSFYSALLTTYCDSEDWMQNGLDLRSVTDASMLIRCIL